MKKRNVIASITLIAAFFTLIIALVGVYAAYAVYDDLFPKAEEIDYPDYSLIESLTVYRSDEPVSMSQEDCETLYEYISCAKPTRTMSVNETPNVSPYYTVAIKADDISIFGYGYIYEERGKTYFEIPYVGIYALDSDALKCINE